MRAVRSASLERSREVSAVIEMRKTAHHLVIRTKRQRRASGPPVYSHLPLALLVVGRHDDACRRYVTLNQLHVHGVRDGAEELFAFSKNYRNGEQLQAVDEIRFQQVR